MSSVFWVWPSRSGRTAWSRSLRSVCSHWSSACKFTPCKEAFPTVRPDVTLIGHHVHSLPGHHIIWSSWNWDLSNNLTPLHVWRTSQSCLPVGWSAAVTDDLLLPPLPAATPRRPPARRRAPGRARRTEARPGWHEPPTGSLGPSSFFVWTLSCYRLSLLPATT